MTNMIVAYDQNRGIGRNGELLWQSGEMREDMKRFRTLTRNSTLIMGRKTLESIGMALPNRRNIVVSHNPSLDFANVEVASSVEEAFGMSGEDEAFVIGGSQLYEAAMNDVQRIYATEVQTVIEGADTFFPNIDASWNMIERQEHESDENNLYPYDFVTYERSQEFVNLANARNEAQRATMERIVQNAECPFCPDNLEKYHTQEILRQGEHWLLTPNQWPYENTDTHLIAIPKYHVEKLSDLRVGSFDELLEHMKWAEQEYHINSGAVAMRFGDTKRNGSSVKHLHMHLIVPSADKPADAHVRFKIS